MPKVLIADDHAIISDGLKLLIEKKGLKVIAIARTGTDAIEIAKAKKPQIVIMDITMPDLNGVDATAIIRKKLPNTKIIALSMHSDKHMIDKMFASGASGYVHKDSAFDELYDAIEEVLEGNIYLSPALARMYDATQDPPFINGDCISQIETLSQKERQVLQMVAEGKKNKVISEKMGLSIRTIETHRRNVMNKLGIFSVAGLTKFAIKEGIIDLE